MAWGRGNWGEFEQKVSVVWFSWYRTVVHSLINRARTAAFCKLKGISNLWSETKLIKKNRKLPQKYRRKQTVGKW